MASLGDREDTHQVCTQVRDQHEAACRVDVHAMGVWCVLPGGIGARFVQLEVERLETSQAVGSDGVGCYC